MKKPLPITSAAILLAGKSVTLLYTAIGTAPVFHTSMVRQPLPYLFAAVWLFVHPKSARWFVGAFFAFATIKEASVILSFAGSTLDLVRRPFSMSMAAWLAWSLLFGRDLRRFLVQKRESNKSTGGNAHRPSSDSHDSRFSALSSIQVSRARWARGSSLTFAA